MSTTTREFGENPFRWAIIGLCSLTAIAVIAIPSMSLSVMFDEIAAELDMTLVQVGLIWGTSSFTGMLIGLIGGIVGDKFGAKRILTIALIGIALFGAARGLTTGFLGFIIVSLGMGLFTPLVSVNLHSVAAQWFKPRQLGLANGVISSGFAAGFLIGALLAASWLSPLLGGWQAVFYLYGAVTLAVGSLWWFLYPAAQGTSKATADRGSLRESLPALIRIRTIWLIGLGKIGVWGCVRGFTGYLPLYLREIGWEPNLADLALSSFFVVSLIGAIPIPMLSDRLGVRRPFLIIAALLIGSGSLMLGFVTSGLVFLAVMAAGIMFDAFMGLSITIVSEVDGVKGALSGTAIGITFLMADFGGTVAPPIGNALAAWSPELPFLFWGGLAVIGSFIFAAIKEPRH